MAETKEVVYRYRWVVMGVFWFTYVVVYMHRLGVGPLAPFLKEDLSLTSAQVGSLMSAAALGYMVSVLPAGWAADRIGVGRLLLIGQVVGGIFMMGMFLVPSYEAAIVVMMLSGFGSGVLVPATAKGVMAWFPVKERATVMGFKQTGVNVGGILAAPLLPVVALALSWRFGFLFLGIMAVIAGIVSFILYKDPPAPSVSISGDGATSPNAAKLTWGRSLRNLLRGRDIWLVTIAGFTIAVVEFAVIAHLVLYLTEELLIPVVTAGGILAFTQVGGVISKPGSGFLSDRFFGGSRRKIYMLWSGVAGAMCLIVAFWGASLSWGLYPVFIIFGVTAIGWAGIHLTMVAEIAGVELAGTATGFSGIGVNAGAMVAPILFGYLVDVSGSYRLPWLVMVGFALACVALIFFVREERRRA